MRHIRYILFALVMLFCWSQSNAQSGGDKNDSKIMEGVWLPVHAELSGQPFPDKVLKTLKLTIRDGKYTVNAGGQIDKGTIRLESTTIPKGINITGVEGPNKDKTLLAIYEITGDTLLICYDLSGTKRPSEFKTIKDTQQFLVSYKRFKSPKSKVRN